MPALLDTLETVPPVFNPIKLRWATGAGGTGDRAKPPGESVSGPCVLASGSVVSTLMLVGRTGEISRASPGGT